MMSSSDEMHAVVVVLVRDEGGRILLQRRRGDARWRLPVGTPDQGETVEDGARRRIRDEIGVVVGRLRLLGVMSGGERLHHIAIAFMPEDWEGLPRADGVTADEVRFFQPSAFPGNLDPADRAVLDRYGPGG